MNPVLAQRQQRDDIARGHLLMSAAEKLDRARDLANDAATELVQAGDDVAAAQASGAVTSTRLALESITRHAT